MQLPAMIPDSSPMFQLLLKHTLTTSIRPYIPAHTSDSSGERRIPRGVCTCMFAGPPAPVTRRLYTARLLRTRYNVSFLRSSREIATPFYLHQVR